MNGEPDGESLRSQVFRSGGGQALSELMSDDPHGRGEWTESEYADILRHQLDAPILIDLSRLSVADQTQLREISDLSRGEILNFGHLLDSPAPPADLLVLTKDFAKLSDRDEARLLPPPVASVLYYAAIAAALLRLNVRITALGDEQIGSGVEWALSQDWLTPALRRLFTDTRIQLTR